MNDIRKIPIVEIGPGTQRSESADGLEYMQMPSDMATYHQPLLPESGEIARLHAGFDVIEQTLAALRNWRHGMGARDIALDHLDRNNRVFIDQLLGEGEVSINLTGPAPVNAQESVLAGVWRVRRIAGNGHVVCDSIQVGDIPDIVRTAAFAEADVELDVHCDDLGPDIQNAPALLVEIADRLAYYRAGDPVHAINLSLLPHSRDDLIVLGQRLGVGPLTILSRGYGNCRIGSTAKTNVWWIKYFNSQDALILNSIEITDVPSVALAANEDIADSALRLAEILAQYSEGVA